MTNTKDVILDLKRIREEKQLSYSDIIKMMEQNGDIPVSPTTLSRVFADGSEDRFFSYETTIRPLAKALLDIENIEDTDDMDTKALKSLLKYKMERITFLEEQVAELEASLNKEKVKHHEKLDEVREQNRRSIEFLKEQVSFKDARMDSLFNRVDRLINALASKDDKINELTIKLMEMMGGGQAC